MVLVNYIGVQRLGVSEIKVRSKDLQFVTKVTQKG